MAREVTERDRVRSAHGVYAVLQPGGERKAKALGRLVRRLQHVAAQVLGFGYYGKIALRHGGSFSDVPNRKVLFTMMVAGIQRMELGKSLRWARADGNVA